MFLIVVLLLISCDYVVMKGPLKVEIENGWVKGAANDFIFSWRGIPYAKPPVGELRFEPPQPADNWTDTWDATYDRPGCIAFDMNNVFDTFMNPQGEEDCLYINVYAPKPRKNDTLLPVMVWIYGGVFLFGNSSYDLYAPEGLVTKGVIFVSFNYRLGIFGFICTDDDAVRCNNGLRDQLLALKWVQKNIKAFGGNPDEVTVFGQSAGAASISYFIISPLAKGLFKRAIMESGSALCVWSLSTQYKSAITATSMALGIITANSTKMISAFKKVPSRKLQTVSMLAMSTVLSTDPINHLIFAPVIELPGPDAIITASSYYSLKKGKFNKVQQLIGYNSDESLYFKNLIKVFSMFLALYDITPTRLIPVSMKVSRLSSLVVGIKIKRFYAGSTFRSLMFPNNNFIRYLTDSKFIRPIQETARLTAKHLPVYMYKFNYSKEPEKHGAAHTDELRYIFNSHHKQPEDNELKCCIRVLFTNFAKYGDPTPSEMKACGGVHLEPTTADDKHLKYINLDREITVGENPDGRSMRFWRKLFDKYANPPLDTY